MEHWVWCKNNEYCYTEKKLKKKERKKTSISVLLYTNGYTYSIFLVLRLLKSESGFGVYPLVCERNWYKTGINKCS